MNNKNCIKMLNIAYIGTLIEFIILAVFSLTVTGYTFFHYSNDGWVYWAIAVVIVFAFYVLYLWMKQYLHEIKETINLLKSGEYNDLLLQRVYGKSIGIFFLIFPLFAASCTHKILLTKLRGKSRLSIAIMTKKGIFFDNVGMLIADISKSMYAIIMFFALVVNYYYSYSSIKSFMEKEPHYADIVEIVFFIVILFLFFQYYEIMATEKYFIEYVEKASINSKSWFNFVITSILAFMIPTSMLIRILLMIFIAGYGIFTFGEESPLSSSQQNHYTYANNNKKSF